MKKTIIQSLAMGLILSGCFTSKKADKQLNHVQEKFPEKVAEFARSKFPCITTPISIDTVISETGRPDTVINIITVKVPCEGQDSATLKYNQVTITKKQTTTIHEVIRIHDVADSMKVITIQKQVTKTERVKDRWQTVAWIFIGLFILACTGLYFSIKKIF